MNAHATFDGEMMDATLGKPGLAQPLRPALFPDARAEIVHRGGLAPWQRRKIVDHVQENLSSSLRVEELARLVRLSKSHFSRAFKATFQQSPYHYIMACRMAYAKELMATSNTSLSQIALECGLTDQAHLCKAFRKSFGTTPNKWRRPNRGVDQATIH